MLNKNLLTAALLLLCVSLGTAALAEELSDGYLIGMWSFQGKQNCGAPGMEHLEIRKNGTFELSRVGQVDAVGFWEREDNRIDLHLVASPHRIDDTLLDYKGQYGYAHMPVFAFDVERDAFDAVVPHGEEVRKRTAYRCP